MTLLAQILQWSEKDLAPWQRDALRRLFVSGPGKLTAVDLDDLVAILKANNGIADPQNRIADPLAAAHLPAAVAAGVQVRLLAMRDLIDVNRIASKQVLPFTPAGMTVIYGGNGSGKSGYSRVLKRACRARDPEEEVHPDLTAAAVVKRVPQATFDIDVGGKQQTLTWRRSDAVAPDLLSGIAVFDSHCARSYLDDEDDVAFLPYGLNIVEALGREVMPAIIARLDSEAKAINIDTSPFTDLAGATVAGQLCTKLSSVSDVAALTKAGTLSEQEIDRLAELKKAIAEADPTSKAKGLKQAAQRLSDLMGRIQNKARWVSDDAVTNAKAFDDETETAIKAQQQAAVDFRAGDTLLPGTGETLWKALLSAAEKYSEVAYPDTTFPHAHDEAQCVLCQQPLESIAADRMKRFVEYVQNDIAKQASEKADQRHQKQQSLANATLEVGLSAGLVEELTSLDPAALTATQAIEAAIEDRRKWLVERLTQHDWSAPPPLPEDALPLLEARTSALMQQALDLEKLADPKAREAILKECEELAAREKLQQRLTPVLDLVQRMKDKAALVKCRDTVKTKAVSDKAKEFASAQVTAALKAALDQEFLALGVGHIKTKLKERAEQGRMKHKLVLDLPTVVDVSRVLSEGEQRSIAIGAFLAELPLSGHGGGVVFDDPVSSLDHHRRHLVARRLVEEATNRQVIVFTHDTVFLGELQALMKESKAQYQVQHLEWESNPGHVRDGLPWEHMGYKQRIAIHQQNQQRMAKAWPPYPNAEQTAAMRREYSLLRATIERVVEDVIFDGIIRRYREQIEAGKLDSLASLSKPDCEEIKRLYQACHNVVDAHDPASGKAKSVPTADQLGKDIADLQAAIDRVHASRKNS